MSEYYSPFAQLGLVVLAIGIARTIYRRESTVDMLALKAMGYIQQKVRAAGFDYDGRTVRTLIGTAVVVSALVGAVISPLVAVFSPFISMGVVWILLDRRTKAREISNRKINDDICYFIGRQLRAGYSLDHALLVCSENYGSSPILQGIARHQRAGASLTQSIRRIEKEYEDITTPEKMLCATIILAHSMGGNSARIFERIGDSFHQTYELIDDTSSALAQVRMSMYVIVSLPVVMVAFSMMLGSGSTMFLFSEPIGWACLVIGVTLELAGTLWMKKLVEQGVGTWTS